MTRINYRPDELIPYINWIYFHHTWNTPPATPEAAQLRDEATHLLLRLQPYLTIRAAVDILPAYSDGDDIIILKTTTCPCGCHQPIRRPIRLPMLRQQHPGSDGHCLCLSDYIRPLVATPRDHIGTFATTVHLHPQQHLPTDEYTTMLLQTSMDRLAEAAAERLHQQVRTTIWGYAPDENLTIPQLHKEHFQGIRPAVGYPCLPDISINRIIDTILDLKSIGITLTTSAMMQPHASVSGLMISLPQARYFSIGQIDQTQLEDYARRRNMSTEEIKRYIPCC